MFCENCGKKIKVKDMFCENCGTKITDSNLPSKNVDMEVKPKQKEVKKPFKITPPMVIGVVIFILIVICIFIIKQFSPETTAKKYLDCLKDNNSCFINYLDVSKDEFFSLDDVEKHMKDDKTDNNIEKFEIVNSRKVGIDGYTVNVIIYPADQSDKPYEKELSLVKTDEKNLGIFPKYIVDTNTSFITKNFKIVVPEKATVKLNGIEVKKYGVVNEGITTYTIPYLLTREQDITVSYMGLEVSEKTKTNYYFGGKVNLNDKLVEDLANIASKNVNDIYKAVVEGKDFAGSGIDSKFEKIFSNIKRLSMGTFTNLKGFTVSKMTFKNAVITTELELKVSYTMDYNYSLVSFDKNVDNKSSVSVTFTFDLDDMKTLNNISNLPTYFSAYAY